VKRNIFLYGGTICLLIAWAGPLPHMAHSAFYPHMIMHMLVVAIAAPLIAYGMVGTRFDKSEMYPRLFAPIPASVGELIIVWGWHAPVFHMVARHTTWGLILEQGSFLIAGIWVWLSAFVRKEAGVIGLLLTSMHMTFLGALLSLSNRSLYNHHHGFGNLSALEDQHIGGAIMLIVGGISYLSGGLWLTFEVLKERNGSINEKLA
jgi:putative membrane protein